jgi:hypothetical protein
MVAMVTVASGRCQYAYRQQHQQRDGFHNSSSLNRLLTAFVRFDSSPLTFRRSRRLFVKETAVAAQFILDELRCRSSPSRRRMKTMRHVQFSA